jgi:uncharacterized protein HemY
LNQVEVQFDLPDQGAQIPSGPLPAGLKQDIDDQAAKVQENPSDALAWETLGGLYWRAGRADYALQSFEEALRLRPNDAPLRTWVEKYHSLHSPAPTPGP